MCEVDFEQWLEQVKLGIGYVTPEDVEQIREQDRRRRGALNGTLGVAFDEPVSLTEEEAEKCRQFIQRERRWMITHSQPDVELMQLRRGDGSKSARG